MIKYHHYNDEDPKDPKPTQPETIPGMVEDSFTDLDRDLARVQGKRWPTDRAYTPAEIAGWEAELLSIQALYGITVITNRIAALAPQDPETYRLMLSVRKAYVRTLKSQIHAKGAGQFIWEEIKRDR